MVLPTKSSQDALPSLLRTSASKRDSLAAELERDPELSTAKRRQRTQAFASSLAHASLERQLSTAQSARIEIESKLREKDIVIERLENDRRYLADRENEERQERERESRTYEEDKRKLETELRSLVNTLTQLRERHAELQDTHSDLARTSSQTHSKQKAQLSAMTRQVSTLTQELTECKHIAEDHRTRFQEMEQQLESLRTDPGPSNSSNAAADPDMTLIRDELHRQAGYMAKLEKANLKLEAEVGVLRQQHASVEVLREEKRALEKKVRMFDDAHERAVRLEAELEAIKRERQQWQDRVVESTAPSATPVSLSHALSALRLEHTRLLEDHGANLAALRQSEAKHEAEAQRAAEAEKLARQSEEDVHTLEGRVSRRDQRISLLEREAGFLKALLASYTAENNAQDPDGSMTDESKDQRIRELESLLTGYKSTNDALIHQLNESRQSDPPQPEPDPKLLEKVEELEQALFELGGEIGGGRHVPPGVRVLSLRDNPEQHWVDLRQSVMDQLRGENEALLNRLKELEAAKPVVTTNEAAAIPTAALVPRESYDLVNNEKTELEETLKQKEKRLLRLQQVFTSKSQEFRDAIASILGVKLAFYPNGQVRVTSLFDLSASFVFQPATGEGGRMQLIAQGEGGPPEIPQLMRHWIEQEQCIPGFLAGLTMDCYDRARRESKLPPGF